MKSHWLSCILPALFAGLLTWPAPAAAHFGPVTLQLRSPHSFAFAGYYAAQAKGFYQQAGFEVSIRAAGPGVDPVSEVVDGRAQYGVGTSHLLLARRQGKPVIVLAAIFQHSPQVLIVREEHPLQTPNSLLGRRVMLEAPSVEVRAMLNALHLPLERLQLVPYSFSASDLSEGRIDAMSADITLAPYHLAESGVAFQIYQPRRHGIDFYGDNLFTSSAELDGHPERVKAFREASLKGWQYALQHPDEIVELINRQYGTGLSLDLLLYQAEEVHHLVRPELVEVGYMNAERWQAVVDRYVALGLLPAGFQLEGFIYRDNPPDDRRWLLTAAALILLAFGVLLYTLGLNRRLDQALRQSQLAEQAMRKSEERHRLLADNATDVIWTMGLHGTITYISPSIERLLGVSAEELIQQPFADWLKGDCAALFSDRLAKFDEQLRDDEAIEDFRAELEMKRSNGEPLWIEATLSEMRNKKGAFIGLLGVARDITQRRQVEQRIHHLARHDPLTDLPNRALLNDRLRQALAHALRYQHRMAVLFIDLDHFKPINDTFGHDVGDQLLQFASARMQACLRNSDTLARVGGDEFVVLLSRVADAKGASQVATKLQQTLREPFELANRQLHISASIGVAVYPLHGQNEAELCKHADEAMYQAKQQGRDGIRLYEAALH